MRAKNISLRVLRRLPLNSQSLKVSWWLMLNLILDIRWGHDLTSETCSDLPYLDPLTKPFNKAQADNGTSQRQQGEMDIQPSLETSS
jgi:hypothetical protein